MSTNRIKQHQQQQAKADAETPTKDTPGCDFQLLLDRLATIPKVTITAEGADINYIVEGTLQRVLRCDQSVAKFAASAIIGYCKSADSVSQGVEEFIKDTEGKDEIFKFPPFFKPLTIHVVSHLYQGIIKP